MSQSAGVFLSPGDQNRLNNGRKRKISVVSWKTKQRKTARNSGSPYISSRKKPVPGKLTPNEGRVCRCQFECGQLSYEEKMDLFKTFYEGDYNAQTALLASCLKILEVGRRRVEDEAVSRRQCTVRYFIPRKDSQLRVCQKTFCNVYMIIPRRLQILQDKIKFNMDLEDKRGLHDTRHNKISDDTRELVKGHIMSFPRQENHYSRNKSTKECLDPELSIKKMWCLFRSKYPKVKCSLHLYRDIFNSDFKLRFGFPRSDSCAYCDRLYIQMMSTFDESKLRQIETESTLHHRRADLAYKTLAQDTKECQENPNVIVICVDLQQVLFCPKLTHNNVFYQRQLSCYNLAVHNQKDQKAMMFFWDESIGKRGAAEITSCILKYVRIHFSKQRPNESRKLVIWSDRCIGQNNNWKMIGLLQNLIVSGYFSSVEQKFMTTGHSFLPCDRDFSLIERKKKSSTVYVPMHWVEVIANASNTKKFEVFVMRTNDFIDLTVIEKSLRKGSFKITENVWYQITSDDPTTLRGRSSHNVLQPWATHCLAKNAPGNAKRNLPPVQVERFPVLYQRHLPIKPAKKKDLEDMCRYIPLQYVEFYNNLQVE